MSNWRNFGDLNPRQGTYFIQNPEINSHGDLEAEMVDVVPESQIGGDENRFQIRIGNLYLAKRNFEAALEATGLQLIDGAVVGRDHTGAVTRNELSSDAGMEYLLRAAQAYAGMDFIDISELVQIGKEEAYDQERKFVGDLLFYRSGTSIWSVLSDVVDGFDYEHGRPKARPYKIVEVECGLTL